MLVITSKKAVSPLIATIILIAFAVALGAVVMNIGKGYVEDIPEPAGKDTAAITCSGVDLNFLLQPALKYADQFLIRDGLPAFDLQEPAARRFPIF